MLGMSEKELGEMTPRTFQNKVEGFDKLEKTRVSIIRWQTANLMNATGNYKRPVKPRDILPMDDFDNDIKVLTSEEQILMLKKYKLPIPKGLE